MSGARDVEAILDTTAHRPWPLPRTPWVMFQSWRTLLFAHWAVPPAVLRPLIPEQLLLDELEGMAWVGLTPFVVADLHARGIPPIPGLSTFPELNLRTYVRERGSERPGIFFFTLDAASPSAVLAARTVYRLPYRRADMSVEQAADGWIDYSSRRVSDGAELRCRYRPTGPPAPPARGTREHFLTERYQLLTVLRNGRVLRGEIHHGPWPLQPAEAVIPANTMGSAHGVSLPGEPLLLHYSARQDTLIWPPDLSAG